MMPRCFALLLLLIVAIADVRAFVHSSPVARSVSPFTRARASFLRMDSEGKDSVNSFQDFLQTGAYKDAYQSLKRNPMQSLDMEDARLLLNNVEALDPSEDEQRNAQQTIDASVLLYKRLQRQSTLQAFDCVRNDYPENLIEVSPKRLEEITEESPKRLEEITAHHLLASGGYFGLHG
ncbi:hypothetical protein B484DRAFT_390452 [Ochromonadaceae sp. CCMP2298]|nr:hypothetical protein B484DRAFT_390452 [Ochromonadaceae sp. CCMP2298]